MSKPYYAPTTLEELYKDLAALTPQSKIIAGGTDLIIELNSGECRPDALLYLGRLPAIQEIRQEDDTVVIGAMATMTAIAESDIVRRRMTAIANAAEHVGSTQIRNKATLAGNIANASPAADLLPALWLFETEVDVAGPQGVRTLPLSGMVVGAYRSVLAHNEAILAFRCKLPDEQEMTAYNKLGSRKEVTISRVGVAVRIGREGEVVTSCSVVAGAVATVPARVPEAEKHLLGSRLEPNAVKAAGDAFSAFILEINNRPNRFYKSWAAKGVLADTLAMLPSQPAMAR